MMLQRMNRRVLGALALTVASLLVVSACKPVPPAAPASWQGPSFNGASGSPSGSKPESKVWFNDGIWWADLWDTASSQFLIHRLDLANHTWVATSTHLDTRPNSRSDSMWDGTNLYVASHVFAEGSGSTATGYPAELRRFSYDHTNDTYTLDAGFPVSINNARTESLVIDEDSMGRIWATWMQSRQIMVASSTPGGTSFSTPVALPVTGTLTSSDDLSSVLAFGGNRIGILWSNQTDQKMYFTSRSDADPVTSWDPTEVAYQGTDAADDHINLKTASDQNGRILAAVKTSESGSSPLVHLLDRDPLTKTWTSHVFGLGSDNHTRPIVLVDSTAGIVHMFASSGQSGGSIYEKTAPLSNINFAPGKGTPVLSDPANPDINNATSTKQTLSASTGLVVLATNDTTRQYWTYYEPLGAVAPPAAPKASFLTSPTSGPAPLPVTFTNTSSGWPTSYAWTFGDGTTSTDGSPTHSYSAPGSYTVTLKVTNASGSDTVVQSNLVTVTGTTSSQTFMATADALVKSTSPTKNYNSTPSLQTRAASPAYNSYLRFDVGGLTAPPTSAVLRLWVTDASKGAQTVAPTSTTWDENTITWNNAPAPTGGALASTVPSVKGAWVEFDVTASVTGNGPIGLVLTSASTDSAIEASRESATPPQLVVTP